MNRDTIIGFVLIAVVLIGFSWWNQPSAEQVEAARKQDSIAAIQKDSAQKAVQQAAAQKAVADSSVAVQADTTALFYQALQGTAKKVVLKNGKLTLTLNTKGGTIEKAVIHGFQSIDGTNDVTLFRENDQQLNFMLAGKQENIVSSELYFTPTNVSDTTVTMLAQANNGGHFAISYRLGKDYMLSMAVETQGLAGMFAPSYKEMDIEWSDHCRQQEKGFSFESRYTGLFYKEANGGTDNMSETADKEEQIEERLDWVAYRNQFFSVALISKDDFSQNANLSSIQDKKGSGYLKQFDAKLKTAFDPTGQKASEFEMYIGPNDFRLIQDVEQQSTFGKDLDLEQLVNLGWWLLRWINRWFTLYVFDWLTGFGFNMGIVLILITLLLKGITFPMVKKSYMSSAKMRVLKPKFEEATKHHPATRTVVPVDGRPVNLRSHLGMGHQHLGHWRPPVADLYPVLCRPADIHMDFYAPAARPDGRCSGRPDEGHAVYDVHHAADVLLHLQRLLVRSELLLLHLAVYVGSYHVDPAQDH